MPILATSELAQQRLAICKDCPLFNGVRCKACGCFMQIKARLNNVSCPHGIWETKDYAALKKPVEASVRESRLNICYTCPQRRGRECRGCSCSIVKLAEFGECPKNKW